MANFGDLKNQLETSFDADGASNVEAIIQINIEDLTNFYVEINDGALKVEEGEHETNKSLTWRARLPDQRERPRQYKLTRKFCDLKPVALRRVGAR